MLVKMIVAISENNGIGKDNRLPWRCKDDLLFFSRTTIGSGNNAVIMGKKTQPLGAGITSSLTLANNPTAGTTLSSTSGPIGAVAVQGVDATVSTNISQMNTFLTDNTAGNFSSNVDFSMISAGDEVKCMEMRGSDTTTGSLGGNFGNGLLCSYLY